MSGGIGTHPPGESHTRGQALGGEGQANRIATGVCQSGQAVHQAEGLQDCCVDSHAYARIPSLDPLQGGAAGECTLGDHTGRQAAATSRIADIKAQLSQ
jgi:hypothetical protein